MSVNPPLANHFQDILGWAVEAIQEGEAFLRGQPGYNAFDDTIDAIMGEQLSPRPSSLSSVDLNQFGKIALDLSAVLTDTRVFWEYRTSNKKFEQQAEIGNKRAKAWYTSRLIDMKFADVIKYAQAMGTGYAHLVYNPEISDQDLVPEDPRDVLPIRPGSLISIQECMGVIIRRERSVNYARGRYPKPLYGEIKADREGSYAAQAQQTRVGKMLQSIGLRSGFLDNLYASLAGKPKAAPLGIPSVDIFTLYVKDDRHNQTGHDVPIGEFDVANQPLNNWSYIVKPNELLYPRRRTIVFTRTALLYDGPNIFWHGLFPVPKLTLDPWPWSWLGKAPLKDLLPLQRELTKLMRVVGDHNDKVGRPGVAADKNAVSRALMERLDTRRSGLKIRYNPVAGKGVEMINEPPLDPSIQLTIQFITDKMNELSGVREVTQLMNLGQIPAAETVEKMLESMSPSVRGRSRTMEAFLREFAMMVLSNFFQFDTLAQRLALLGPDGMTWEDFDYDPKTLIPDFVMSGDFDSSGSVTPDAIRRGPLPRYERARTFLDFFKFHAAPGSLLEASEITSKLLYIQLSRAGLIDHWTLLEKLQIPNVGEPPQGAATITDRLMAEQQMGLNMNVSSTGRKASGQQMPSLKGGHITES